jgi:hypothetical protein
MSAAVAGLALGAATLLTASTAPTAAAPNPGDALVFVSASDGGYAVLRGSMGMAGTPLVGRVDHMREGDFTGATGTGVLLYAAGSAPDSILSIEPAGNGFQTDFVPLTVNGTYTPVVADVDGNGLDDVLWYAPGAGADSLWRFAEDGSHTSVPLTITGTYQPVVLDADGDERDDILWYAPGRGADSLWLFGADASHRSRPVRIDGRYRVDPGRFGDTAPGAPPERLLFTAADGRGSIWTFDADGDHTSVPFGTPNATPVIGDFHGTGRDELLWYGPGVFLEGFTTFDGSGASTFGPAPQVSGTYAPVVADLDGDDVDDIAWTRAGRATVWSFGDAPPGARYRQWSLDSGITDAIVGATADEGSG